MLAEHNSYVTLAPHPEIQGKKSGMSDIEHQHFTFPRRDNFLEFATFVLLYLGINIHEFVTQRTSQ
jgi:hypothetical protein